MKKEVSPVVMIVVIILAVVVIGGIGWFMINKNSGGPTGQHGTKPGSGNTMVDAQV